jgi:uncharacterized membrane protein
MRVMLSKLCGCAAGLACLSAAPSAKADIKFCNQFPQVVYVAIAYPQDGGSWLSRGWMSLETGECSVFDTALRVKTFYYRAESVAYRSESGWRIKTSWGSGRKFAIYEDSNFNYWNAVERVLKSSLAEFTHGPETTGDAVSATVTFDAEGKGSSISIK